jgi:protein-tyrosine-phosphatase
MAGAMFERLAPQWRVTTAGTHVVEGQPISWRTKEALDRLGFDAVGHRSHQLTSADVAKADLMVTFERFHVAYVRSIHPQASGRTSTLPDLAQRLAAATGTLPERLRAVDFASLEVTTLEEVADPAGGDVETVAACARLILDLSLSLVATLDEALAEFAVSPPAAGRPSVGPPG